MRENRKSKIERYKLEFPEIWERVQEICASRETAEILLLNSCDDSIANNRRLSVAADGSLIVK